MGFKGLILTAFTVTVVVREHLITFSSSFAFLSVSPSSSRRVFNRSQKRSRISNDLRKVFFQSSVPYAHEQKNLTNTYSDDVKENEMICTSFGGEMRSIKMEGEDDGFISTMSVPTYGAFPCQNYTIKEENRSLTNKPPKRFGLEGIIPHSFILHNALSIDSCEDMIKMCEEKLGFGNFDAGKNKHGALQLLVSQEASENIFHTLSRFVDVDFLDDSTNELQEEQDVGYSMVGVNRRWRVYRYDQGGKDTFAPHIDAGFPPSSLSKDGTTLIWDASKSKSIKEDDMEYYEDVVSRLTILMYLNDDFTGGNTNFFTPVSESAGKPTIIASVKPKAGSILVFPQAVGEDAVTNARLQWPLHEGSPIHGGNRPKYVVRSDVLFRKIRNGLTDKEKKDPLWCNDDLVRQVFKPQSPVFDSHFLSHVSSLYNPHMGVENAGPLLYSFIRFTKVRKIVEIGAGYTTIWLLQALKDNDDEIERIKSLQDEEKCRLLDIQWSVPVEINKHTPKKDGLYQSQLFCVDNCLHQRETATGASAMARKLGLIQYLKFLKADAFDMDFEPESTDLLWCDFGVGSRMKDFVANAWQSIRPGGFLICHSTLTNSRTRSWLEAIRSCQGENVTGIPAGEYSELSFLEPTKHYQNSITILQRRKSSNEKYIEPLYSEYA